MAVELELLRLESRLEGIHRRFQLESSGKKLLSVRQKAKAEPSKVPHVRDAFDPLGSEWRRILRHRWTTFRN
jgi:hypothetical protein